MGIAHGAFELGCATDIRLAVDCELAAIRTYGRNFGRKNTRHATVESLFDGGRRKRLTGSELEVQASVGRSLHFLVGGPPCQGHSDLNNHTRRSDGKNALYLQMARAAMVLRPRCVIIENVPAVLHDRNQVMQETERVLDELGYRTASGIVDLSRIGVPQTRRRHVLLATKRPLRVPTAYLGPLLAAAGKRRTIAWAISDLAGKPRGAMDEPSRQSKENERRAGWLYDNEQHDLPDGLRPPCHRRGGHSYRSVYGRLKWDEPAQTITSGFTSMGQGRFLHPSQRRTLTPREAARLQFFPDFFDWGSANRTSVAKMIGNAVPPKLTMVLAHQLIPDIGLPIVQA